MVDNPEVSYKKEDKNPILYNKIIDPIDKTKLFTVSSNINIDNLTVIQVRLDRYMTNKTLLRQLDKAE